MARARAVKGLHRKATLLENARAIVAVRVAEMFDYVHAVGDPAQDEDLHNMRIAAKRLRYTLEMFRVCLTDDGATLIDTVKEIQERIGTIHDADVLIAMVRLRLAIAAQHRAAAFAEAARTGTEEARLAAVRAVATGDDPSLGLAGLLARTDADRTHNYDAFTDWWREHGGDGLRARLNTCLKESHQPSANSRQPEDADEHPSAGKERSARQPSGEDHPVTTL